MHTSSGVDNIDEYTETIVRKSDGLYYKYGNEERRVPVRQITVPYKTSTGLAQRAFTVYRTDHGPIVKRANNEARVVLTQAHPGASYPYDKWVSVRLMQEPLKALTQSFSRTKSHTYEEFRKVMDLHANSSNNTIYANADGVTAYFHANFIPKRDPRFNWKKPVDGSDPATEWGAPLSIDESPLVVSPKNGWLYNSNNWPFSAAGADSPKQKDFAAYVERGVENPRGIHAARVLVAHQELKNPILHGLEARSWALKSAQTLTDGGPTQPHRADSSTISGPQTARANAILAASPANSVESPCQKAGSRLPAVFRPAVSIVCGVSAGSGSSARPPTGIVAWHTGCHPDTQNRRRI